MQKSNSTQKSAPARLPPPKQSILFGPNSILHTAPFAADADRLIDVNRLMSKPRTAAEASKRDVELRKWRHQGELRGCLITPDSVPDWQSWMFGTLMELRMFSPTTASSDRCQCKET